MREFRSYGSVRGALSNERPYRELSCSDCIDSTAITDGSRGEGGPMLDDG